MTVINDLIEDWIQIRATLQRQIRMLESDDTQKATKSLGPATDETVAHLKTWVHDLNKLLKEHAGAQKV